MNSSATTRPRAPARRRGTRGGCSRPYQASRARTQRWRTAGMHPRRSMPICRGARPCRRREGDVELQPDRAAVLALDRARDAFAAPPPVHSSAPSSRRIRSSERWCGKHRQGESRMRVRCVVRAGRCHREAATIRSAVTAKVLSWCISVRATLTSTGSRLPSSSRPGL